MDETLRALIVEDSPSDAKLTVLHLRGAGHSVQFERVDTARAMLAALEREPWDIVLSDWSMPRFSGLAALAIVKEKYPDLPFIILSGTIGEETAVEAMRAGAHDYVLKGNLARLGPAVARELRECKDRAARRQAEVALRESEARFRRLSESGIIGIVIANIDGRVLLANDAYLRLIAYSDEELQRGDVRWVQSIAPEHASRVASWMEQLGESGFVRPTETELLRRDRSRVPVLIGVAMLDDSRCIAFVLDLSEQKRAERESMRLAVEAETAQVGRQRAEADLRESERQLRHAQKMEAVGRLAGGVAHDFNNVLSVIMSYSELILEDLKPGDAMRADIEEVRKAASRAAGLTHQLLMFSRQQVLEPKVIDLCEVLKNLDKMLRRVLGEDVELTLAAKKAACRIKVDPSQIEQVILNLVVNARDAMPTGGKLTIEARDVVLDDSWALEDLPAKPGPYVMMSVTDTGTGMDADTQARIFEPFFTTKEMGKGTGLGLSTVFGIVHHSGGSIAVQSEVAKGTTFQIFLPRVEAELDVIRSQVDLVTLRGHETVLVVEDRGASADHRPQYPASAGLPPALGRKRDGGAPSLRAKARGDGPPSPHRRGDAADERARPRQALGALAPTDEGPLHVGVHGRQHRPSRSPRDGLGVHPETDNPYVVGKEDT
ncbi:MAG TPA: ATP-binding protein [Polyangiaceae bacterium]|jgi:hypothetical protein